MFLRYLLVLSFSVCKELFYENDPSDSSSECSYM